MVSIHPALFTHHVSTGAKVSSRFTTAPTTTMPPTTRSSSDTNLTKQDFEILKPLAQGHYGKSSGSTDILHEGAKQSRAQPPGGHRSGQCRARASYSHGTAPPPPSPLCLLSRHRASLPGDGIPRRRRSLQPPGSATQFMFDRGPCPVLYG
ncbi:hypothetical protein [Absidia glauca]|uniref:Uncharacterized protein n=1 Tax=Absidia glauca TaxID=4829 RepID=A0A163JZR1_ABSGL|nr:hypothetical protein [Absidia glauca]